MVPVKEARHTGYDSALLGAVSVRHWAGRWGSNITHRRAYELQYDAAIASQAFTATRLQIWWE